MKKSILAGDLGGTKTNLAVFSDQVGPRAPLAEATFLSSKFSSLSSIVNKFLACVEHQVAGAVFGVAGPVVGGCVKLTNLDWEISEEQLGADCSLDSVHLLNDLVATAYSIPFLERDDIHTVNEGRKVVAGAIGVIDPGT